MFRIMSAALFLLGLATGCADPAITRTARNSVEQLLLATVIERGVEQMEFNSFTGRSFRIDYSNLNPQVDKNYLQGMLEAKLATSGVILSPKPEDAEFVLKPLCGVLATEDSRILVGTPPLPIPLPETDINIVIPELALFKKLDRKAAGRFSGVVLKNKTNQFVAEVRQINTSAIFTNWVILFVPYTSRDFEIGATGKVHFHFFD